jgi:serine/threonine-protein kinase RsbW
VARIYVALELPPQAWTVAVARHAVHDLLTAAGAAVRDQLVVAVSEACGNVILHAGVPSPYLVRVEVEGGECVVVVTDQGSASIQTACPDRCRRRPCMAGAAF